MRIGIDARFYQESGVGRYLRNLIFNLQTIDQKNEYFIFFLPKDYDEFKQKKNFQKVKADFLWYGFAEQLKFPSLLKRFELDLVHFPHFNVPIFYKGKFVVTIHDLIHQHYVMKKATTLNTLSYRVKQFGYKRIFKTAIKKSLQILVPSSFVKEGLIKEWSIDQNKIRITPEAVDDKLLAIANKVSRSKELDIIKRFKLGETFLFYVGNAHPHKNVEGLIQSFLDLKKTGKRLQLVLSGQNHYFWQRIKDQYQCKDIIYTGKISDEELVAFYRNASCFIMPSFEEGFGIPILEAMSMGCPVASSNAGSLREVGGDAALYFNPNNPGEMIGKISQVLNDGNLRKRLIEGGLKRSGLFSWEKLAKDTLTVYNQ